MEDTAVLSPKSCDLQDPLGQQCVPVLRREAQLTTSTTMGTISHRDTDITDTARSPGAVPKSPSSSQTHIGTLMPALTTTTHSPHVSIYQP